MCDIDLQVLYLILVNTARESGQLTYGKLSQRYEGQTNDLHEPHGSWDQPLGTLNTRLNRSGLPPLSAVVVLKGENEPGGMFWGSCPSVPERPSDEIDRIVLYGQILSTVYDAAWPDEMP